MVRSNEIPNWSLAHPFLRRTIIGRLMTSLNEGEEREERVGRMGTNVSP